MKKNSPKAWLLASRPKTLTGAAVPVMIGLSLAWADNSAQFSVLAAVLCLLFAFVMQIDANFVNDYFDYMKGTDDTSTRLGPKRACAEGWVSPAAMRWAMGITTMVACAIGLPLIAFGGWQMVLVGMACVLFCFLYTTHLSYRGLGDVLVVVFFGLVPVSITYYVELQTVTFEVVTAALACGLVVDCLLIVNNFRDRDTDREANKLTLVVRLGAERSLRLYLLLGVAACAFGFVFLANGRPWAFGLPLIYLLIHHRTYLRMRHIWQGKSLNEVLALTARNQFIYALLVSLGVLMN